MPKKKGLFNPYKFKRKMTKRLTTKSGRLANTQERDVPSPYKHNKDFSWRKRKQNPFDKEDTHYYLKKKLKIITLVISIIGCLYIAMYHSFFHIKKTTITGTKRINIEEVQNTIESILNYKKLFVFPGNNYFLVDVDEIKDILLEKFPIETVKVEKNFPNSLSIFIEEKIATIIYDNGEEYVKIGTDGYVTEKIRKVFKEEWKNVTTTTIIFTEEGEEKPITKVLETYHTPDTTQITAEVGEYPILYNQINSSTIQEQEQILSPTIATNIVTIYNRLTKQSNIPFSYITLTEKQGRATIHTKQGWQLFVDFNKDPLEQIYTLEQLIQKNEIPVPNISYVNLQFLPQVYWE
ncbi:MAG: FtsQ-type POTRA domain-containing protein [Candidatus Magasanikbacteria bacterium]|nr:FtsQ-type POTRA domain-containing protein [Candidatus Magasanikbacteria bacterium]NCS72219.1 FtsQ-type POTRA domain-containing protein [Candidatus Magasanikbacteria bacterium]